MVWSEDATTERGEDPTGEPEPPRLVLRGALPEDDTEVALTGARWVLGRGDECDVRLTRTGVSRAHAEIVAKGPTFSVRDLGSTNGTFVDGERVEHGAIGPGSVLRVGAWLGVVEQSSPAEPRSRFGELAPGIWGGPPLARALGVLSRASASTVPVLLIGRTGTGKERFARALHDLGGSGRPFHAINCAALLPTLVEAELFGYAKGSFTGADRAYAGRLRAANGGTLFLDEIADLPLATQAKLLRALDTGEISPLGEAREARFSARVVAACREPLSSLVAAGQFRDDLAARLGGLVIPLPELRERRSDIPKLFETFLRFHSGGTAPPVSCRLHERLCLHDYPGNVRELELLARKILALHGLAPVLRPSHLPEEIGLRPPPTANSARPRALASRDRNDSDVENLMAALRDASGNVRRAAELSGISRQRAYRLIGSRRLSHLISGQRVAQNGRDSEPGD